MPSKDRRNSWFAIVIALLLSFAAPLVSAADTAQDSAEAQAFRERFRELDWVRGPTEVEVVGNSKLKIPEGYAFLDQKNTDKYLELTRNFGNGTEMMVAPESLDWAAYFSFSDDGYVKDDEKIDAPALLKSLQEGAESSNDERRKRGWEELYVDRWAIPPAYNSQTKRLEWATVLRTKSGEGVNFFTKVLGRRGHTTVVLVTAPEQLRTAQTQLDRLLGNYTFNSGDKYAEFVPGDKVAQYGLAALVLGGAAAIATKKGFWAVLAGFFATAWKFIAAAVIGLGAWLKRFLGKNKDA